MAKQPNLTDLTGQYGAQSLINNNNALVKAAFDNTISRDGSTPNQMEADLDLNSNDLLNVGSITAQTLVIDGSDLTSLVGEAATSASTAITKAAEAVVSADNAAASFAGAQAIEDQIPDWQGEWLTATAYETGDLVRFDGAVYICLVAHTSGTFSTDLSSSKWELFVQKGAAGAGTGDMLAANNLSDVDNTATSLSNIGGQPVDNTLTSLSALGTAANKFAYTTGVDTWAEADITAAGRALLDDADAAAQRVTLGVPDVIDEDDFATDSATRPPSQQSTKAYVDAAIGGASAGPTATTSGSSVEFNSIPSGITEIDILFNNVSPSGTDTLLVQISTGTTYATSGYVSGATRSDASTTAQNNFTSGFAVLTAAATTALSGILRLTKEPGSNVWLLGGVLTDATRSYTSSGYLDLAEVLDGVRITFDGSNTFDGGQVSITYRERAA